MIQAEYLKTGICGGCGARGCLLIRAEAFIEGLRQASSIWLCIDCVDDVSGEALRAQNRMERKVRHENHS